MLVRDRRSNRSFITRSTPRSCCSPRHANEPVRSASRSNEVDQCFRAGEHHEERGDRARVAQLVDAERELLIPRHGFVLSGGATLQRIHIVSSGEQVLNSEPLSADRLTGNHGLRPTQRSTMLTREPPTDCPAAREAVSARVDGELSELEAARLDAHLLRCPDCRRFAAGAAALARELRSTVPERPRAAVVLARQPRRLALSSWAAAASLVLAVSGSSFALGHAIGGRSAPQPAAIGQNDVLGLHRDSTRQHVLALLNAFSWRRQENGPMRAI
jgi:hypothetical protein